MTLKDLREEFEVLKYDDTYRIYSKTESGIFSHKFLCIAFKKGNSFYISDNKPTTKVDTFKNQVENYLNNLEYDSEYYDPLLREGFAHIHYVHTYLTALGFKNDRNSDYTYKPKNVFGGNTTKIHLSFIGLEDNFFHKQSDRVKIIMHTGDWSWMSVEVNRDFKELKNGINSFIKPLLLTEGVRNINDSEKLDFNSVDYIMKELNGLSLSETNYKETLKNKLLEIAHSL